MQQNQDTHLHFHFDKIPKPFTRGDRALIVLKDLDGKFVLGCKDVYPHGIYRLPGGGREGDESPLFAAGRELQEELGITRTETEWSAEKTIHLSITSPEATKELKLFLFATVQKQGEILTPSDDLDGIMHLSVEEMHALIDRFYDLSDIEAPGWADYGKVYGKVHEIALLLL